jgi:peptide/nickel transport system substrate-binding protein
MKLKIKKIAMFIAVLTLVLTLFGCSEETSQPSETSDKDKEVNSNESSSNETSSGGELQYAIEAQPPTIDPHMSTATATRDVASQIFEPIVTINTQFDVVPVLAESVETSDDGKTYIFHLRKGIKFHNGKEMTSEDVLASMNRWKEKSATAQTFLEGAAFSAKDKYTLELQLKEPSAFVLSALAGTLQFAGIMPKEIVESADSTGIKEYIGTGPFKFKEWKQDQYIHLTKFEDYQSVDSPPDGLAGKREVLVDDLYFQIVVDPSTLIAGLQTGQYHIGANLTEDVAVQIQDNPDIKQYRSFPDWSTLIFDKTKGWFTDQKMRQAVNAAINLTDVAKAAHVDNYRMNPSYMMEEQKNWYSNEGSEIYTEYDPERAKRLLEEAGYNGEEIVFITTRDYEYMYNAAVVIKEQLEKVGMKVKLEVYDWATITSLRQDPEKFELFITALPVVSTPVEILFFQKWVDGPEDEKTKRLLEEIKTSTSMEEAKRLYDELQEYSWNYLPVIKIADLSGLSASSDKVEGLRFFNGQPILWNTKVVE